MIFKSSISLLIFACFKAAPTLFASPIVDPFVAVAVADLAAIPLSKAFKSAHMKNADARLNFVSPEANENLKEGQNYTLRFNPGHSVIQNRYFSIFLINETDHKSVTNDSLFDESIRFMTVIYRIPIIGTFKWDQLGDLAVNEAKSLEVRIPRLLGYTCSNNCRILLSSYGAINQHSGQGFTRVSYFSSPFNLAASSNSITTNETDKIIGTQTGAQEVVSGYSILNFMLGLVSAPVNLLMDPLSKVIKRDNYVDSLRIQNPNVDETLRMGQQFSLKIQETQTMIQNKFLDVYLVHERIYQLNQLHRNNSMNVAGWVIPMHAVRLDSLLWNNTRATKGEDGVMTISLAIPNLPDFPETSDFRFFLRSYGAITKHGLGWSTVGFFSNRFVLQK